MTWIHEKARAMCDRIRDARAKQVYPLFRELEAGSVHTQIGGNRSSISARTITSASRQNLPSVKEAAEARGGYVCYAVIVELPAPGDDPRACRLREALCQVDGVRELPSLHDRLPGDARHPRVARRQGHDARSRRVQPRVHPGWRLSRCGRSQERSGDPVFQSQLRPTKASSASSPHANARTRSSSWRAIYSLDGDTARTSPSSCKSATSTKLRSSSTTPTAQGRWDGTAAERSRPWGSRDAYPSSFRPFRRRSAASGGWSSVPATSSITSSTRRGAFLFSASHPVPIVAAASTILDIMERDGEKLVAELHQKAHYFRDGLTRAGFDLGASNTHIMPVMCREERKALLRAHRAPRVRHPGWCPLVYPSVKQGEERLRVNVTRGHTEEDLDKALELLKILRRGVLRLVGRRHRPAQGVTKKTARTPRAARICGRERVWICCPLSTSVRLLALLARPGG